MALSTEISKIVVPVIPNCTACELTKCMIQRYVSMDWKRRIEKHKTFSHYQKGQLLFNEGNPVNGVYFIYSGKVKVFLRNPNGTEHIIRLAGIGDIVGHRGLTYDKIYPVSAASLEDSTVGFIPYDNFVEMLNYNPPLFNELMTFLAEELKRTENRLRSFSQMTVKQRLAEALLNIRRVFGEKTMGKNKVLNAILSRQEMADMTGASIEEIIRTISQLKKEGIINGVGKHISIKNEKKLLEMIEKFPAYWK